MQYFRVWPANPIKLPDGTWKTYEGGLDICFRVKHAKRDLVVRTVEDDLRGIRGGGTKGAKL